MVKIQDNGAEKRLGKLQMPIPVDDALAGAMQVPLPDEAKPKKKPRNKAKKKAKRRKKTR